MNDDKKTLKIFQNVVSLRHWLEVCSKAGVPYIPATFSEEIMTAEIFQVMDGVKCETPTLDRAAQWLKENLKKGDMWRWDVCAPNKVKYEMDKNGMHTATPEIDVDDCRFFEILFESCRESIPIAIRPWVKAAYEKTHPVEFRVFVFKEGSPAVTNYYPQRALPRKWLSKARECVEMAKRLKRFAPHDEFAVDFLVKENKSIVFLEGSPWWGGGSHPCCFAPENVQAGNVALKKQKGALV